MPRTSRVVGLRCPSVNCNGMLGVKRISHTASGSQTRRIRVCRICGSRWATTEQIIGPTKIG